MTRSVLLLMYFVFLSGTSIGYYLAYRITTKYWRKKYRADLEALKSYIDEYPKAARSATSSAPNLSSTARGIVSSKS